MRYLTILPLIVCVAGHAGSGGQGPIPNRNVPAYAKIQTPEQIRTGTFGIDTRMAAWCPGTYPKREMEYRWDRVPFGGDVNKIRQVDNGATTRTMGTEFGMLSPNTTYAVAFNVWYWSAGDTNASFVDANATEPSKGHRMSMSPSTGATSRVSLLLASDAEGIARMEFRAKGVCALALNEFVHLGPANAVNRGKK